MVYFTPYEKTKGVAFKTLNLHLLDTFRCCSMISAVGEYCGGRSFASICVIWLKSCV